MMRLLKLFFLTCCIFCCKKNTIQDKPSSVKYFSRFKGYSHPFTLVGELDSSNIKDRKTYYRARYENNLLASVKKFHYDTIFFKFSYTYDDQGIFLSYYNGSVRKE